MTIEILNNYKVIVADENKILVLPDETLCIKCYTPLNFDENTVVEKDYIVEEIEPSAVETFNSRLDEVEYAVIEIVSINSI